MRRILKVLAVLLAVGVVALGGVYLWARSAADAALAQTWTTHEVDFPVPFPLTDAEVGALRHERLSALASVGDGAVLAALVDPAVDPLAEVDLGAVALERAVARGEHLVRSRLGCAACHGDDLGGKVIVDAMPVVGRWVGPNITSGGRTKDYTVADWDRAVRHGVLKSGASSTMPSAEFVNLSDRELSDVIAWLRTMPPVASEAPPNVLGPVFLSLIAFQADEMLLARQVDHQKAHTLEPPAEEVSATFGEHLGQVCTGCHGPNLAGGEPEGDPNMPYVANLTPHETGLKGWTEEDFLRALREGRRPDGTALHPTMPWQAYGQMTDVELKAIWAWLQTLPPVPKGQR